MLPLLQVAIRSLAVQHALPPLDELQRFKQVRKPGMPVLEIASRDVKRCSSCLSVVPVTAVQGVGLRLCLPFIVCQASSGRICTCRSPLCMSAA